MDVVFLGTAGSMPTADRSPTALLVRRGGERLLFDCAEGTQRQLLRSSLGLIDLREVFLTHYHADHYLGLPGMLKTFALRGREVPITIHGPPGLVDLFRSLRRIFGRLTYRYELEELRPGDTLARDDYRLVTFPVEHSVSSIGYALVEDERPGRFDVEAADALGVPFGPERGALQRGEAVTVADGTRVRPEQVLGEARPGRTIVIPGDTAPARSVLEASRYFGPDAAREARAVFPETVVPRDFDIIDVRFQERGGPHLIKGGALPQRGDPAPVENSAAPSEQPVPEETAR